MIIKRCWKAEEPPIWKEIDLDTMINEVVEYQTEVYLSNGNNREFLVKNHILYIATHISLYRKYETRLAKYLITSPRRTK